MQGSVDSTAMEWLGGSSPHSEPFPKHTYPTKSDETFSSKIQ